MQNNQNNVCLHLGTEFSICGGAGVGVYLNLAKGLSVVGSAFSGVGVATAGILFSCLIQAGCNRNEELQQQRTQTLFQQPQDSTQSNSTYGTHAEMR